MSSHYESFLRQELFRLSKRLAIADLHAEALAEIKAVCDKSGDITQVSKIIEELLVEIRGMSDDDGA
jgi:hypothetical protein